MKKRYYSEEEREALCRKYISWNRSRKEFCELNGISPKSLSRWLHKDKTRSKGMRFLPLGRVVAQAGLTAEILLPNEIRIRLSSQGSELLEVITGLLKCT